MTTFADIKVGDRVRLTGNGEVHEFVVQESQHRPILTDSGYRYYNDPDSWEVEIIQKPLPTGEYAVIGSGKNPDLIKGFYFEALEWRNCDGMTYTEEEVRELMRKNGLEVLFEGVQK